VLIGVVADHLGQMRSLALMQLMMASMLVLWWASTSGLALALMAIGFGLAFGAYVATFPSVVMGLFGARSVAGIIGFIYTAAGIGTLFGPTLAGAAYDATSSYSASILSAATLALLASAVTGSLARAPRPSRVGRQPARIGG
jgi:predicted MFS family arabinose efflux permease